MTSINRRRDAAFTLREAAANQAKNRTYSYRQCDPVLGKQLPQPTIHVSNNEEKLRGVPLNFTKGLPHDRNTGLVRDEASYDLFVKGIKTGDLFDFKQTPLGPLASPQEPNELSSERSWLSGLAKRLLLQARQNDPKADIIRGWEASGAGLTFDLQGPDPQAVTMPPAPSLGSDELTAEMAEVYLQAALRDLPFSRFNRVVDGPQKIDKVLEALNSLPYFGRGSRKFVDSGEAILGLNCQRLFRGIFRGDTLGPYVSQFLLVGNTGINGRDVEQGVEEGFITYGALRIDQRVREASKVNYMTSWEEYIDVQNGADFRGQEEYEGRSSRRFIATPRDLATYVHYDALYEAYLNACLILLSSGASFDPGIPFQAQDVVDHHQGFALFGGPHILTLVTEVATRALKAVRFQKFQVHRRCRPEALAARLERLQQLNAFLDEMTFTKFSRMDQDLENSGVFDILMKECPGSGKLLPMAFAEGSPMHPSYGAGHATVAGACTTVLKAWFDHEAFFDYELRDDQWQLSFSRQIPATQIAFQAKSNGRKLESIAIREGLTVEGELNKVAANISIGRDWAGVHFYSDYVQSMLLGEEIAIGMLQEQSLTYLPEDNVSMTIPKFDGSKVKIIKGQIVPIC